MTTSALTTVVPHVTPTARSESRNSGFGNTLAWQREMELAQSASWFAHGPTPEHQQQDPAVNAPKAINELRRSVAQHDDRKSAADAEAGLAPRTVEAFRAPVSAYLAANHPVESPRLAPMVPASPVRTEASGVSDQPLASPRATPPADIPGQESRTGMRVMATPGKAADLQVSLNDEAGPESTPETDARPTAPKKEIDPMRVHVERQGRRANVWLGIDAPLLEHLPNLAATVVRTLRESGHEVDALTCNGKRWDPRLSPSIDSTEFTTALEGRELPIQTTQGETR